MEEYQVLKLLIVFNLVLTMAVCLLNYGLFKLFNFLYELNKIQSNLRELNHKALIEKLEQQ